MKLKLPYTKEQFLEYAAANPKQTARRIIKANVDDVSTHSLIAECQKYMFQMGAFDSLKTFNDELKRLGCYKG